MAASKMASSVDIASDMFYDYMCTSCEESELNKEALFYCHQCTKLYCGDCAKAHNLMYKKHKLLGKKDVSKWGAPRPTVRGEQCPLHAGNVIQMYCKQHDVVGCTVCILMDHRDCKTTQHIPDVAKGIFQSSEFKNLPASIKSSQNKLRKKNKTKKQHSKVIDNTCDNIIKSAKDTRKRVDREMARLEKKTIEDVEELRATLKAALKADEEGFEKAESELQQFLDAFQDKAQQHETSAFVRLKTCKQKLKEAENLLKNISEEPFQIRFNLYKEIETNLSSFESLGTLDVSPKSSIIKPTAGARHPASSVSHRKQAGHAYTVDKYQPYNLHISKDEHACRITGLCSLPNGNFLAVDNINKRVKQLNGQYDVIFHLDFQSYPIDICHLGDYQVAVTVSGKQIHYLDASNSQLKLTKKVTCDHVCIGIDYHNDQLYVTSGEALYIYNRSGKLMKKLYEDNSAEYTVRRVSVARDGQHIYVTNYSNHQFITLDNQGNKLATFSDPDLKGPEGLCTAENGTVFVGGYFSNTVVQVSSDRTKKLATVDSSDGVDNPWSLLFHEATAQLIVGQRNGDKSLLVMSIN